jgi:hypothetical protein
MTCTGSWQNIFDRSSLLLSLVEVPEKANVPFMVNAFDYMTFIHRLTWDLPGKFWRKREIINFHNYWFLICGTTVVPIVIWDYVRGQLAVTFNEQTWRILKNLAWNKDHCLLSKCRRRLMFPSWLMHLTTWHLYTGLPEIYLENFEENVKS